MDLSNGCVFSRRTVASSWFCCCFSFLFFWKANKGEEEGGIKRLNASFKYKLRVCNRRKKCEMWRLNCASNPWLPIEFMISNNNNSSIIVNIKLFYIQQNRLYPVGDIIWYSLWQPTKRKNRSCDQNGDYYLFFISPLKWFLLEIVIVLWINECSYSNSKK